MSCHFSQGPLSIHPESLHTLLQLLFSFLSLTIPGPHWPPCNPQQYQACSCLRIFVLAVPSARNIPPQIST